MNKRAIVTGASGEIGGAIALALAKEGYDLLLHCGKDEQKLRLTAEKAALCGVEVRTVRADFCDGEEFESFLEVSRDFGCDLLVNNAGVSFTGLFQDMKEAGRMTMRVDLFSPVELCRAVIPGMIAKHSGNIINISSIWGLGGASCEVDYSVSKAGLIGLTRALADEVGPSGVRVNCVAPGYIETKMNSHLSEKEKADFAADTPLQRPGEASDVADAVVFLAGEKSSFITGEVLTVSGGRR